MLITIITVVKNGIKTIENLINQINTLKKYIDIEYIVIDGNSTDGTIEFLRKNLHCIDILVSEKDDGIYHAMNKGLNIASGDYCIFIGADDLLVLEEFIQMRNYLVDPETIYHGQVLINGLRFGGLTSKWKILRENIPHQAIFYPISLYKKNHYNTKYRICSDHEYNIKLIYSGWKCKFIEKTVAIFSTTGISSSSVDQEFSNDFLNIVKNNAGKIIYNYIKFGKITKKFLRRLM